MARGTITITITVPVVAETSRAIDSTADLMRMKASHVVENLTTVNPDNARISVDKRVIDD